MKSKLGISGVVYFTVKRASGTVIHFTVKNRVVLTGFEELGWLLVSNNDHRVVALISIGTRSDPVGDTALNPENAVDADSFSISSTNNETEFVAEFNLGTITQNTYYEAVIRGTGRGSVRYSRVVFDALNLGPTDTLTLNWVWSFS